MRLDIYITNNNNIQSRNKASELIKSKKVFVDGKIVTKPSFQVEDAMKVVIDEEDFFVSRAAYKLKYFLEENDIKVKDAIALDIGSSTGGFTQILLKQGVQEVTCVDVGSNQLHESLKDDKRIIIQENMDIRKYQSKKEFGLVTCDVSFISILYILDDINRLSDNNIIILYKPQFEVGREIKRDSNGVVKDQNAIELSKKEFLNKTQSFGWKLIVSNKSKVSGKSGNIEELYYFKKS